MLRSKSSRLEAHKTACTFVRVPWWVTVFQTFHIMIAPRADMTVCQVWTFNVASIMILVHTSTVVHSMIRSMRRPLLVLASIITWLGVFQRPSEPFCPKTFVKGSMFQWVKDRSFPKISENDQVWHSNHWTQRPGYSLHALWCLLVSLWEWDGREEWPFSQERRVGDQAMGNLDVSSLPGKNRSQKWVAKPTNP